MAGPTATTPKLWVKADAGAYKDAGVTLCADGDTVQQWNDQSGNGNNLSQATAGNRPTYRANIVNALPVVRCSHAASSYLKDTGLAVAQPLTAALVFRTSTEATSYNPVVFDSTDNTSEVALQCVLNTGDVNGLRWLLYAGTAQSDVGRPDVGYNIHLFRVSGGSATYRLNGETVVSAAVGAHGLSGVQLGQGAFLDGSLDGDLCECLAYDSSLSDAETKQLEGYLSGRWQRAPTAGPYVMVSFMAGSKLYTDDENLRVYSSADGLSFVPYPAYYTPHTGTVRDPRLFYRGGWWYLAHTNCGFGSGATVTVAKTQDFQTWTWVLDVDYSDALVGVNRAWSPAFFADPADGGVYLIASVSNDAAVTLAPYIKTATAADLSTWSSSRALTGAGIPNAYDFRMYLKGGTYQLWFTNNDPSNANRYIEVSTAASREGPYAALHTGDWAGWGAGNEGTNLVQRASTTWRAYFFNFLAGSGSTATSCGLYYSDSTDDQATWSAKAALPNPRFGSNSGVVIIPPLGGPGLRSGGALNSLGIMSGGRM